MHIHTNSLIARIMALGSVMAAVFLSGCGGGGGNGGGGIPIPPVEPSSAKAVLVGINDPSGIVLPTSQGPAIDGVLAIPGDTTVLSNYSPVAIHVTYHSPIPANEIIEYHVYRPDFKGVPLVSTDGKIFKTRMPVFSQSGASDLSFWDDGLDRPLNYTLVDSQTPGGVSNVFTGPSDVLGTGLKLSLVGKRFSYVIEVLYKVGDTYKLSGLVATNPVTYMQPARLTATSFTGVAPDHVHLNEDATLGADDYILELSSRTDFADKKTITPYDPSLIQTTSANQTNPRLGVQFPYFNPNTGFDMTTVFPGAPATYARIGIRDSRNGLSTASNPYLYSETAQVPSF